MSMARAAATGEKKQNRVVQFWQVFQMTRKADPSVQWMLAGVLLLGAAVGVLLGLLLSSGNVFVLVIYILIGVMLGVLLALLVLGRRAERAAFKQIEGQPGAVGAVLRTSLARGWRASEVPVAVDGRTKDAVYRAVGRPGVVLIAEGPKTRTQKLVDSERRRVTRVSPNVPISVLVVSGDAEGISLHQVAGKLRRLKPTLTRAEVLAVANRLESLASGLPVPKGIDPNRVRPVRR